MIGLPIGFGSLHLHPTRRELRTLPFYSVAYSRLEQEENAADGSFPARVLYAGKVGECNDVVPGEGPSSAERTERGLVDTPSTLVQESSERDRGLHDTPSTTVKNSLQILMGELSNHHH